MNEQVQAILNELNRKAALDPQLRQIMKKIGKGKATFEDTALLSQRMGNMLGELFGASVLDIPAEVREAVCMALLKERYKFTNETLAGVQEALDEPQGISLEPQRAPFPSERVKQLAHALIDPTVAAKTIQRRADKPVATVAKSFHDDYIKTNAKVRAELGLKPTITRYGTGCCKWCSEVAGRYRFGEQPEDVFRRHDNCDCVIIYDTQVLRGARTAGGGRSRAWEEVDPHDLEVDPPKVLSQEEARQLQAEQLDFMSNSFRPAYSAQQSTFHFGTTRIPVNRVENSQFELFADTTDRRSKAVRTTEKLLRQIQSDLPQGFGIPPVLVVDFEKFGLNVDSKGNVHDVIGGFAPDSGALYINSRYDTAEKILAFVTKHEGRFANQTEYAPILHELGHKYYEDSVKRLAISGEMSYNEAKDRIDSRIFEYIKSRNTDGRFVLNNISGYADKGYGDHSYTEIVAECFSVLNSNQTAMELLRLLEG